MSTSAKNYEFYTYEEFEAIMTEENRYKLEYDNGYIYYMSPVHPNHDRVKNKLASSLINHIGFGGPCEVFTGDVAVKFEGKDETRQYQPDIMICCDPSKFKGAIYKGIPRFVVEILSHATEDRDLGIKLTKYEAFGVQEYWIINISEETVTVYNNNIDGKFMTCSIYNSGMTINTLDGFSIGVSDIFSVLR